MGRKNLGTLLRNSELQFPSLQNTDGTSTYFVDPGDNEMIYSFGHKKDVWKVLEL